MKKRTILIMVSLILSMAVCFNVSAANGLTADEWRDFYSTCGNNDRGMHMFADAACKNALNPNYIKVDMTIEKLADPAVNDAWIALGIVNTANYAMSPVNNDPAGLVLMLKKSGGKLSVSAYSAGFGKAYFENSVMESIAATGTDLSFVLKRDSANSTWNLYLNGSKLNADDTTFKDMTTASFTDENGKAYVSFAAFDAHSDALNARVWTVLGITDVDPEAQPSSGSSTSETVTSTSSSSSVTTSSPSSPETSGMVPVAFPAILTFSAAAIVAVVKSKRVK